MKQFIRALKRWPGPFSQHDGLGPTGEGSHGQQQHYDGGVGNQVERSNAEQQRFEKA
jgi:hypothetical protein